MTGDEIDWGKVRRALSDRGYDWRRLNSAELHEAHAYLDASEERWFAAEKRIAKWRVTEDGDSLRLEIAFDPQRALLLTIPKSGGMYDGEPNSVTVWTGNNEHDFIGEPSPAVPAVAYRQRDGKEVTVAGRQSSSGGESIERFRAWLGGVGRPERWS
jgi:hypothetical protein